jgi:hypothetical protein
MSPRLRQSAILLLACGSCLMFAQGDPRGAIFGHVSDPTSATVGGAKVIVKNTQTGVITELSSNDQGYYEAPLLIAGTYQVDVTAGGFKGASRPAFDLPAGSRLEVNFKLELGAVSDSVTVNDAPPMLNVDNASAGMVLDKQNVRDLPWPGGNPTMLVWMAPGAQTSLSISDYSQRLHSGGPANNVNINGKVGGNEFTIDGTSNNANGRGVGFNPAPEFVQAVKVETSGFDASFGHSTGAGVSMMTNSGTNQLHGVLREMHEQYSWRAVDLFTKKAYYTRINQALAAGDTAGAQAIRNTPALLPGRENSFAGSLGGPIVLPKVFDGRNKLFFFFGYAGFRVGEYRQQYNAFPTSAMRTGDFSSLLKINSTQYQIYDPYSTVPDATRAGHVVRQPFAGNQVPASRIINPAYKWMANYLPLPNSYAGDNLEPNRDFTVFSAPYKEAYNSFVNRYDYNISANDRVFFKWSRSRWQNSGATWYYYATPNLWEGNGNIRTNTALGLDWVHNFGASTLLDVAVGSNFFQQDNMTPALTSLNLKPSDAGYPTYLDQQVSSFPNLPNVSWSGWTSFSVPASPSVSRWRVLNFKADASHMRGNHTLKAGFEARGQFFTGYAPGNNAGTFAYSSTYTQRTDDGQGAAGTGSYGGSWAAFMMGLPTSASADVNASQVYGNPFFAAFIHDGWRVSSRLTLNLGLRMEYELGPSERYNRLIGYYDPAAALPIASAAQAAYAKSAISEVPSLTVQGGAVYPNVNGSSRRIWSNSLTWQPRISAAYQVGARTVIRTGYGLFIDTLNVENESFNQLGYSWATSTSYTTDFGQNWTVGNPAGGLSPMTNPFPTRADGSRFDTPPGSSLGAMAPVGRGFTYVPFDRPHARQNRWRLDVQRELGSSMVLNVGYAGSYSDRLPINQSMNALPAQYWWYGTTRNDTIANNLNTNITNPYNIANFAAIKTSNPALYQLMSTNSFFTSGTIRKSALLSPYSWMNGLTATVPKGKVKTHELDVSLQRRFSNGSNFMVSYTKLYNYAADYFPNTFDNSPAWEPSNQGRPHRLTSVAVAELPFGKGRRWLNNGVASWIVGGFQITEMQEYQPGELVTWGSTLYYTGNLADICSSGAHTLDQWFNTSGFVTSASQVANTGQARVFPNRINGYSGCRADSMKRVNGSLQREFQLKERARVVLRWDVYNVTNHGQLALPNVSPTSTDFGKVTGSYANGGGTPASNRSMRVIARIIF